MPVLQDVDSAILQQKHLPTLVEEELSSHVNHAFHDYCIWVDAAPATVVEIVGFNALCKVLRLLSISI